MKIGSSCNTLRSNWRGTAKAGATLDGLRPLPSLVWDACLNQFVSRLPSRWDGLVARDGVCPGKEESAEENSSSRSAKGNKYMRRVLNQAAHAAARSKGTHFQAVFRRLLPRLGYQSAVWAIAHRLCRLIWKILHEGIRYIEQSVESELKLLIYRAQYLAKQLRKFGYNVQITPTNTAPA